MHFETRNVNTAFQSLVKLFDGNKYACSDHHGPAVVRRSSRNGPVLVIDEPVMITYSHPRERVLFNRARDASPFLHLYEALWMLAGRNDVAPLAYYASNMANYSDDGQTLNGAYGYRWRHAECWNPDVEYPDRTERNQLDILVDHLKADPTSRRAVLQMWNVEDDLLKIHWRLDEKKADNGNGTYGIEATPIPGSFSKDVCCNLSVMFSIWKVNNGPVRDEGLEVDKFLDMTVINRSNDLIWGTLGGDYTTFSFLQEYVAARIGVDVGKYTQMSNNLHVYEKNWKPEEWLKLDLSEPGYGTLDIQRAVPLIKDPATFEEELPRFVEQCGGEEWRKPLVIDDSGINVAQKHNYTEPFLCNVAWPMMLAFRANKYKGPDLHGANAYIATCLANIKADDWRIVATNWITKRKENRERRIPTQV